MAENDDVKDNTGAVPGVNVDDLMEKIDARMQANLQTYVRQNTQNQPAPTPVVADPLTQLVRDTVRGENANAGLMAEAAMDAATFYGDAGNQGDGVAEDKDEIEKTFQNMLKSGRPMPRADIWAWMKGKNLTKYQEKQAKRKADAISKPAAAADIPASSR